MVVPYPTPKTNLGLRNYKFMTYPARVLYYAVGLYLIKLSQDFIQGYCNQHKHIASYYGGKLLFNNNSGTLPKKLKYDSIWYKPHYQEFKKRIQRELDGNLDNRIIIHIDIQNYYDELSIQRLLGLLKTNIKPTIQRQLNYDEITQDQIKYFIEYLQNGKRGIPQTDNDIVSAYIGHLFLVFGDLLIDEELNKFSEIIQSHAIIRFMDDMYISITFKNDVSNLIREIKINDLASRIADCLYEKLELRLNTKTRLFWLNNPEDIEDLHKNLKKVSPDYETSDDSSSGIPSQKVDRIFDQLETLKNSSLDPTFRYRRDIDEEILKEVYTESVRQLLDKPENKIRMASIFTNFNFDLVMAQPKEIVIILLQDKVASEMFEKFLLAKGNFGSRDVHLILTYLCQTDFKSLKLINVLKKNHFMCPIIDVFLEEEISSAHPGYYDLIFDQVSKISEMPNVIEQIRLRIKAERRDDFSVALNHLVNEIHAICYELDSDNKNKNNSYQANETGAFLLSKNVPHATCIKIRNLFDRRNKNTISHADPVGWSVSEDEYYQYHKHVGICLNHVLEI